MTRLPPALSASGAGGSELLGGPTGAALPGWGADLTSGEAAKPQFELLFNPDLSHWVTSRAVSLLVPLPPQREARDWSGTGSTQGISVDAGVLPGRERSQALSEHQSQSPLLPSRPQEHALSYHRLWDWCSA